MTEYFDYLIRRLYEKFKNASPGKLCTLKDDSEVVEYLGIIDKLSLPILSVVPSGLIPDRLKSDSMLERYALEDSSSNDHVKVSLSHLKQDTCSYTLPYFKDVLFERSEEYGHFTKIYLREELIGIVKHVGNNIFLAMRTKNNEIGAYPLIKGGLYSLSTSMTYKASSENRFAKLNVDSLTVRPMKMLYKARNHQHRFSTEILPEIYDRIK